MQTTKNTFLRRRRQGLTLVEIVVVIALIGILMSVLGGSLLGTFDDSKRDTTRISIGQVEQALEMYKIKKNKYPKSLSDAAKYMRNQEVPKDAWSNDFEYSTSSSCGKPYEITSYARDGKKGGSDNDADISSCDKGDE
jgi:general secretion pathway protein G